MDKEQKILRKLGMPEITPQGRNKKDKTMVTEKDY